MNETETITVIRTDRSLYRNSIVGTVLHPSGTYATETLHLTNGRPPKGKTFEDTHRDVALTLARKEFGSSVDVVPLNEGNWKFRVWRVRTAEERTQELVDAVQNSPAGKLQQEVNELREENAWLRARLEEKERDFADANQRIVDAVRRLEGR